MWVGSVRIPDPDPRVKQAQDPGSGSATLIATERIKFLVFYGFVEMSYPKPRVKS